ncbi:ATP-dependent nuclease [Castellaniella sp.]|uniref:ATP-dependent nuclease n=1 Tax=Castellaniella sp. TaxID=1955812 RepID=UPI003C75DF2A
MDSLPKGKRKAELGLVDNKDITIQSILGIRIHCFRSLRDQSLILGENVTVLSGRNGTMKTSLMGLLAHPFSSDAKDAFGAELKTPLKEVFKFSPQFDKDDYSYDMRLRTDTGDVLSEPVSIYRVEDNTNRHRIVVSGSEKGDGNFYYNTSFLNLKRLFPLVDTRASPTDLAVGLSPDEAADLKDFYETIFPSSEYEAFVPVHQKKVKTTFAVSGASARYDWHSISSGEDNLRAIFNRLVGFRRKFNAGQRAGNGILCIDEFESSLHPVAQLRLLDYLYRWSAKYKVQIVVSTHSLHLIQDLYLRHAPNLSAGRIVVNFISKSSARDGNFPILQNPDYDLAYKELTLTNPEKVVSARKVRIFCEDEYAVHFAKRLIKSRDILSAVEFHSSLDPDGGKVGTSWPALKKLCIEYPLLLEGSLALFDADVGSSELRKIKNKDLYLVLPDADSLAIERRIIAYIIGLENDDAFFARFGQEREAFLMEFKAANIRSLALADIVDPEKTSIDRCKAWADTNKAKFKQYVTYYCDQSGLADEFRSNFVSRVNKINQEHGLPLIG